MTELETERLRLRSFAAADFEAYAEMCADPEVMRYLGGKTFSRVEAWRHLASMLGHWQLRGYGQWAVEVRNSGRFLGRVGFVYPEGWPGFELGWALARPHWGNGYATEAARVALDHAFTALDRDRVISLIHPDNERSRRVAERLGETPSGRTEVFGIGVVIFAIDREQWRARDS